MTHEEIIQATERVAEFLQIASADLIGDFRHRKISEARQAIWWVMYNECYAKFDAIAQAFGRTPATIQYGVKRAAKNIRNDINYAARVQTIQDVCRHQRSPNHAAYVNDFEAAIGHA